MQILDLFCIDCLKTLFIRVIQSFWGCLALLARKIVDWFSSRLDDKSLPTCRVPCWNSASKILTSSVSRNIFLKIRHFWKIQNVSWSLSHPHWQFWRIFAVTSSLCYALIGHFLFFNERPLLLSPIIVIETRSLGPKRSYYFIARWILLQDSCWYRSENRRRW